jgi:CubicO group peptidase (beta-lactamase class C family)
MRPGPDRPGTGEVDGQVAPGYEAVRAAFADVVRRRLGWSGAVAAFVDGRCVVDLWGGPDYRADSLQPVHSVSKGLVALGLARLMQRGALDPDAPVGDLWPEFAAHGKGDLPVRGVLSHQAGVPTVDGDLSAADLFDHDALAARVAAQRPFWKPGTRHGYHGVTYGTLADELVRRVTGETVAELVVREVTGPLAAEVFLGLPAEAEERLVPSLPPVVDEAPAGGLSPLGARVLGGIDGFDWGAIVRAGVPAIGGVASARGLARVYAACLGDVDGRRLLSDATVARVAAEQVHGPDEVLPIRTRFGTGFLLGGGRGRPPASHMAGDASFGHDGMGGHLAFADPQHGLAFGFTTNQPRVPAGADPCTIELVDALLAARQSGAPQPASR